jgi:hypothetical protein
VAHACNQEDYKFEANLKTQTCLKNKKGAGDVAHWSWVCKIKGKKMDMSCPQETLF